MTLIASELRNYARFLRNFAMTKKGRYFYDSAKSCNDGV